jgi:hypothetical protein
VLFCRTICQVYLPAVAWAVGLEDQDASGVAVVRVSVVDKDVGRPGIGQLGVLVGGGEVPVQPVGTTGAVTNRLSFGNAPAELILRNATAARHDRRCMLILGS